MDYPLSVPGFEGQRLAVRPAGLVSSVGLLLDGRPVKGSRGRYVVHSQSGAETTVVLKPVLWDSVPKVEVDGRPVTLAPPLSPVAYLVSALPLGLIGVGGAIGGAIGGATAFSNIRLFRAELPTPLKYLAALAFTAAAWGLYLAIALALQARLRGGVAG